MYISPLFRKKCRHLAEPPVVMPGSTQPPSPSISAWKYIGWKSRKTYSGIPVLYGEYRPGICDKTGSGISVYRYDNPSIVLEFTALEVLKKTSITIVVKTA